MFKNQKGITLVEILASIALMSIVVGVFLAVFSNYLSMNNRVEEEVDSQLLMEEASYYLQHDQEVGNLVVENAFKCSSDQTNKEMKLEIEFLAHKYKAFSAESTTQVYYTSSENETYGLDVHLVCQQTEEIEIYPIHIQISRTLNDGSKSMVTETYKYISRVEGKE